MNLLLLAAVRLRALTGLRHRFRGLRSPLSVREATLACVVVILVVAGGAAIRLVSGVGTETMPTWTIGGDFTQFYVAGRVLNEGQAERLYNPALREGLYPELIPRDSSLTLPFNYPPFIAVLFRPLALLSLPAATLVFLIITLLIYGAGVWLIVSRFIGVETGRRTLGAVAALSFAPFLLYTWLGAQISFVGLFAFALAICEEDRERPFLAGMAVSICLYKPTLLLLPLPMLLVTRRFRMLAGFATGGTILALVSVASVGPQASAHFLERLGWWGRLSNLDSTPFKSLRYVDLRSFLRLAQVEHPALIASAVVVGALLPSLLLLHAWSRAHRARHDVRLLSWAAALTWGLVLNVYTPFYDCVLVVPACVLAVAAAGSRFGSLQHRWLGGVVVLLYLTPWVSEVFAGVMGIQLYTLVLYAFGAVTLVLLNDVHRRPGGSLMPSGARELFLPSSDDRC